MTRAVVLGVVLCLGLVACSGSDDPVASSPSTSSVASPTPEGSAGPSPSGEGFCTDRVVVGDAYQIVKDGAVSYQQAAAAVIAAGKVIRTNVELASTDVAAKKLRQLVLFLNTMRLAILGAAENYPDDYAVKQLMTGLLPRVQDISDDLGCSA